MTQKSFGLSMPFDEALSRLARTPKSATEAKSNATKKAKAAKKPPRPGPNKGA